MALSPPSDDHADTFESSFATTHDRIWPGEAYWSNPLEDWQVLSGRLEPVTAGEDRNIHLLTHVLGTARGNFTISVQTGALELGPQGSTGFRIGIREPQIDDYRGNVFFGEGIDAGLSADGRLFLAGEEVTIGDSFPEGPLLLELTGTPELHNYSLTLRVTDSSGTLLGEVSTNGITGEELMGNLALVNNHNGSGSRFWFRRWQVSGPKVVHFPERAFGPILWSMYSLSDSRDSEGYVLKLSAQLPPIGENDGQTVALQVQREGQWHTLAEERIDARARNALFRIPDWPAAQKVPYRLVYETTDTEGTLRRSTRSGVIQKDPSSKEQLVIASLNCQHSTGFPYGPVEENLRKIDPDMLVFHGDQLYEGNGGYGVVRNPENQGMERATVNYLRKFYMFGWAFGEVMRDRPTLVMPDDHDVFQGNIWGEGGAAPDGNNFSTSGGYLMPPEWVNMVYRTQTSHHPDFYDSTPAKQGIRVWYGDMVYGGVSFALISERMFKSSPHKVDTGGPGRADLVERPDYNPEDFNKEGLTLLGDRQMRFLENWVGDWRGASMKVLLGQTPFANLNTHSGPNGARLYADLDTNGWPQTPRNDALRIIRKGFAFHLNGDQHLPTVIHYGIDEARDAGWGFCPPGVSVGWPRWWLADDVGIEVSNRPSHGFPNTGQYTGPFGHPSYLYSVGNPTALDGINRYDRSHQKASGFGVLRLNTRDRTIRMEAYRFLADVDNPRIDNQFPGWPVTIQQQDNYGRKRAGYLQEVSLEGVPYPVIKVFNEETEELVYALRASGQTFRPYVFTEGRFRVEVSDPETGRSETFRNLAVQP